MPRVVQIRGALFRGVGHGPFARWFVFGYDFQHGQGWRVNFALGLECGVAVRQDGLFGVSGRFVGPYQVWVHPVVGVGPGNGLEALAVPFQGLGHSQLAWFLAGGKGSASVHTDQEGSSSGLEQLGLVFARDTDCVSPRMG